MHFSWVLLTQYRKDITGLFCSTLVTATKCAASECQQNRYEFGGRDPRGEGGTQIFSYIRRLGSFFVVQKFEFQYLFIFFFGGGGVQKNDYYCGMTILGGHHKIGLYLGVISMQFRIFS